MSQRPYVSPDEQAVGSIDYDPDCSHPHDQVERIGDCRQGCCTDYRCGACGKTFRFEWPD